MHDRNGITDYHLDALSCFSLTIFHLPRYEDSAQLYCFLFFVCSEFKSFFRNQGLSEGDNWMSMKGQIRERDWTKPQPQNKNRDAKRKEKKSARSEG